MRCPSAIRSKSRYRGRLSNQTQRKDPRNLPLLTTICRMIVRYYDDIPPPQRSLKNPTEHLEQTRRSEKGKENLHEHHQPTTLLHHLIIPTCAVGHARTPKQWLLPLSRRQLPLIPLPPPALLSRDTISGIRPLATKPGITTIFTLSSASVLLSACSCQQRDHQNQRVLSS